MPCTSGPSYEQSIDERNIPAMLCALISALTRGGQLNEWLDQVDWQEAGVTREWFKRWWKEHSRYDSMRRAAERAAAREQNTARATALAKLTPEERAALHLPPA